jgi:hypothetical protein
MLGSTANVAVLHHVAGLWLVSKQLVLQEFREIDDGWVEKSLNPSQSLSCTPQIFLVDLQPVVSLKFQEESCQQPAPA